MIIKSIYVKEGFWEKFICFSEKTNLIHSNHNSSGKTTLLRFILYALGYQVSGTKHINFEKCEVDITIISDSDIEYKLTRYNSSTIEVSSGSNRWIFILPEEKNNLHSLIFQNNNIDLLENLLGAYYIDQEKGWTLLNRGTVIGSVHFSIEGLIRGLSGIDNSSLIEKKKFLESNLAKYDKIIEVYNYQNKLNVQPNKIDLNITEEKNLIIEQLILQKNTLTLDLKRINEAIKDNNNFRKFITNMKLVARAPNGEEFLITKNNIVGFDDLRNLLITEKSILTKKIDKLRKEIFRLEIEKENTDVQITFFDSANWIEIFDKNISKLLLDIDSIKKEKESLKAEINNIEQLISQTTRDNNDIIDYMYNSMIKYAAELNIGDNNTIFPTYLFTSNLKELSGAILHKTVFSFRLAYILTINHFTGIKLPIILDSPSGKEIDKSNIELMINILKRDFSSYQIIIASIFEYGFNDINKIELDAKLIDNLVSK